MCSSGEKIMTLAVLSVKTGYVLYQRVVFFPAGADLEHNTCG